MNACKVCRSRYRPIIEARRARGESVLSIERHIFKKYGEMIGRFAITTHHDRGHHLERKTA